MYLHGNYLGFLVFIYFGFFVLTKAIKVDLRLSYIEQPEG